MNKQYRSIIQKRIHDAAPALQKQLPSHKNHPHGRIAIAHCYHVLKSIFGKSLDQVGDDRLQDALDIVQFCIDNPTEPHICTQLYGKYSPEPEDNVGNTLDDFLG